MSGFGVRRGFARAVVQAPLVASRISSAEGIKDRVMAATKRPFLRSFVNEFLYAIIAVLHVGSVMRPWPSTYQAEIIPNTDLQSSNIEATFRLSVGGLLRHRDPQSDLPKERVMGRKELVDELFEKANGDRHVFEESLREAGIPFVDADSEESQAFIAKYVTYDLYGAGTGVLVAIE